MGGFLQGLGHVLKAGWEMTDPGRQQVLDAQRKEKSDNDFAEAVLAKGWRPVQAGAVNDNGVYRRVDPTRIATHKTAKGEKLQFEIPTPEEQIDTHARQLMQQLNGEAPARRVVADESVDTAGRTAGAQATARLTAENADTQANGFAVPSTLEDVLPGMGGRKVSAANLDNIVRAGSNAENINSQIAQRKAKPTKTVKESKQVEDDKGNVVQVTTFDDGTVQEQPLKAKGKTKVATGGITPYEALEIKEREAKKKQDYIDKAQKRVDDYQTKQDDIVKETEKLNTERASIVNELDRPSGDLTSAQRGELRVRLGVIDGTIAGNQQKHGEIEKQKKGADVIRRQALGQTTEQQAPAAQAAPAGGQVAVKLKDGTQHYFPDQKAADGFKNDPAIRNLVAQ